jgi:hypothetical protein
LEDLLAIFCVVLLLKLNGDQISSGIVTRREMDSQSFVHNNFPSSDILVGYYVM